MKISRIDGETVLLPSENKIRFVGEPLASSIYSSDDELYFVWQLKEPIKVYCSLDINFPGIVLNELYIRESTLKRDDWSGSPKDGFYIDGWIADYSKNMAVGIYQETTISHWLFNRPEAIQRRKEQRKAYVHSRKGTSLFQKIRQRMEANKQNKKKDE
ncbi:MAG TPA: hypothetical protein VGN63_13230 [Flavisolibacter sp.]|jgi:hypothetical protein|nr:hypothetical protein [Flavisolibacter sp.]